MSLVVLEGVDLSYGGRSIIKDLNLRIGEEDRIGLIGRNGTGKSTLMKIIARAQEPDSGSVRHARSTRVGYLPQELEVAGGRSLIDFVLSSLPGRAELETTLAVVEDELERAEEQEEQLALSEKLANLHEDIAHFDEHFSPHEARAILAGLGFKGADADRDLSEFSGGWKMRAVLASLLFQKPDILMLDEPTNHLDVATVTWLEEFLKRYGNALLLVCHDREFLNAQVNKIVSYEPEGIRQYPGDYERYKQLRAEEKEVLERRAANLAREREANERFIRRFRAQATKARAVQSRVKALEKLDDVVVYDDQGTLSFRFPPCERAGADAIDLRGLGHAYGALEVFDGVDLTVRRGDKVAIIGPNGAGKTTLLAIIAGRLDPTRGSFKLGYNVTVGYYAQHVADTLDRRATVFDEVWHNSALDNLSQVRSILGTFLFSGDDVDKKVGVLSGGEKARVALARLMVNPGNLLLMDEPTNHLDLESSEALAQALTTYDGTLVFVSHNRSFIERLATRIWHVHDGGVEEFPGSFAEFRYHLSLVDRARAKETAADVGAPGAGEPEPALRGEESRASTAAPSAATKAVRSQAPPSAAEAKADRARAREESKALQRRKRAHEKTIAELERRIAELEEEQARRSAELSQPEVYDDQGRYSALLGAYTEGSKKLEELMARWERAQASLAEVE